MTISQTAKPSIALSTARRRFDHWRGQHSKGTRLPQNLWQTAVALAREHGLCRTARTLGLEYNSLKKRFQVPATDPSQSGQDRCEFLELLPRPIPVPSIDCTIEFDDPDGRKLRMYLRGAGIAELASLADSLRGGRA